MSFVARFIHKPVMTTVLMVGLFLAGVFAFQSLAVSDLPNVDFPTITVSASLPGASPETMAASVATPLEKQFSTIAGIDNMTSSSTLGQTQITLQFSLERDVDAAAQDVQAAISATLRQLPQDITPPSYQKVNPANSPILFVALSSTTIPLSQLDEIAQTQLAQRLSTVNGVAQVQVYGTQKRAVHVQMDPQRLARLQLGTSDVASAIAAGNPNLPSGTLWGDRRAMTVQADGQLWSAEEFGNLVVTYRNGAPVRVSDVARVYEGVQNDKTAAWFGGPEAGPEPHRAIALAIQRQPGTNTVEVADAVKALMASVTKDLPGGVKIDLVFDRSRTIRENVHDVEFTLVLTLVLVVLVVFVFLRSPRATAIPSLALPLSVAGTFAVMKALGYSLDNLSLMALTLAVGLLVDDAIVVLENIMRHREMGKSAMDAALDGSREVAFTVLSMTLSLTAVFLPLLFMGGIIGRLFREFGVTLAVSILISGVVSLTLTPMLSSRFIGAHGHADAPGWLRVPLDWFERAYEASHRGYARTLHFAMRHRPIVLGASGVILVLTYFLFKAVPTGFLPSDDTGFLNGTVEAAQGTSYEDMVRHQSAVAALLHKDPNVEAFMSTVGGLASVNQGRLSIRLTDAKARALDADGVARELTAKLNRVPGVQVFIQNPPTIRIGGRQSKALYQFTMQGTDLPALYAGAGKLEAQLRASASVTDVTSDLQLANPTAALTIDRDRAAALHVSPQAIEQTLYDAYGSRQVSTIYTSTNQYWVILELDPAAQRDAGALGLLYVKSTTGAAVPLAAVTTANTTVGPLSVNHSGQVPSVTLSFNLREGVALGTATAEVERAARAVLPPSIATQFSGTAQAFQDSQAGLGLLLLLAVLVIYGILAILYESFIHPITILSGLPFAVFGALGALLLTGQELTLYAFVGLVLLVGIVKKNAIMMVDFAVEAERSRHLPAEESVVEACLVRYRPIMMTTFAAIVGTLPIALGLGTGAASRRPLGIVVVGGLAFSQLVTLYLTPVIYTYFDALQRRLAGRRVVAAEPVPVAGD
jgi:HAE1 family hydrophobic/amphiphilic exporter-1